MFWKSGDQLGDIMTKPLNIEMFEELRTLWSVISLLVEKLN